MFQEVSVKQQYLGIDNRSVGIGKMSTCVLAGCKRSNSPAPLGSKKPNLQNVRVEGRPHIIPSTV